MIVFMCVLCWDCNNNKKTDFYWKNAVKLVIIAGKVIVIVFINNSHILLFYATQI